ncbi:MAG: site-2 protease family protein [Tissierellia bacterium]|nr:site-2 protease family protein [Tissierellia bacterium]
MRDLIFLILALTFTTITHELAHGYVAYLNGDDTAKNAGRLTFNPIKHIDASGLFFLIVFRFGWAKPVPIDERKFKNRRWGLFLVSIAGVLTNFLTASIAIFIMVLFYDKLGIYEDLFRYLAIYGLFFCVFNLIPIPPLDGSKVLASFLPIGFEYFIYKYEKFFYIPLTLFLFYNKDSGLIFSIVVRIFDTIVYFFINLLGFI